MNTTIFLDLILVIVGETLEDEMGYDPTFTVPITRRTLEESWDYSSGICDVFPSVKLTRPRATSRELNPRSVPTLS